MTSKASSLKILLLVTPLLFLAGCSMFGGGKDDPDSRDRLVTPPDLSEERQAETTQRARRSSTLSEFASGTTLEDGRSMDEDLATMEEAEDGTRSLVIREAYLQGWRRTGLALDRAGFTVDERDRSTGTYLIRYDPGADSERKSRGFFSRLAFWRDREPEYEPGNYIIRVRSDSGQTRLTVEDEEGSGVAPGLADRLLTLVDEQLR